MEQASKAPVLQMEMRDIQVQLRDAMARLTDIGSPEAKAIQRAISWLKNVTNPLCDAESDAWLSVADDVLAHMNSVDYDDQLTDEDKRSMTSYMVEE